MEGWIKLHRSLLENPLWTNEPFSRGQAWVDLLLIANHDDSYFYKRGIKLIVKRGQVGMSELGLSARWKWSKNKLRKFLKDLENEDQIRQQKNNVTNLITILNYDTYQKTEQQTEQQSKHQKDSRRTPKGHQKDTYKNVKNVKNEKKNIIPEKISEGDFIQNIISVFSEEYFLSRETAYEITAPGKERSAAGKILALYKKKYPEAGSEEALEGLRAYFQRALQIKDTWMHNNMTLPIIASKFNEINQTLRNGNTTRRPQGATDQQIAAIIARKFATDRTGV